MCRALRGGWSGGVSQGFRNTSFFIGIVITTIIY
jgi:hypothetical protein